jgi:probable F420-dependent oxidoreductase
MDVGLLLVATTRTGHLPTLARRAEELGLESLWIPDHPVIPVGFQTRSQFVSVLPEHYGRWLDPFVALTVAAASTTRLKLATGICLFPERHPLITAKEIASLDQVSGGRVILGVGAGWLREETEAMGAEFRTRWKRLRETVEAMRALWKDGQAAYEGELVRFPLVRSEPKPVQPGGPPVILGGHGRKAYARLARTYDGWCPIIDEPEQCAREAAELREVLAEAGRDPAAFVMTPFVDPRGGTLTTDFLKAYADAGAKRIVLFSQQMSIEMADGGAADAIERTAGIVERARRL